MIVSFLSCLLAFRIVYRNGLTKSQKRNARKRKLKQMLTSSNTNSHKDNKITSSELFSSTSSDSYRSAQEGGSLTLSPLLPATTAKTTETEKPLFQQAIELSDDSEVEECAIQKQPVYKTIESSSKIRKLETAPIGNKQLEIEEETAEQQNEASESESESESESSSSSESESESESGSGSDSDSEIVVKDVTGTDPLPYAPIQSYGSNLVLGSIECSSPGLFKQTTRTFPFNKHQIFEKETRPEYCPPSIKRLRTLASKNQKARNKNSNSNNSDASFDPNLGNNVPVSILRRGDIIEMTQATLGPHGPVQTTRISIVHDNVHGDGNEDTDQKVNNDKSKQYYIIHQVSQYDLDKEDESIEHNSSSSPSFISASNTGLYLDCKGEYRSYNNYGFQKLEYTVNEKEDEGTISTLQTAKLLQRDHVIFPSSWFITKE